MSVCKENHAFSAKVSYRGQFGQVHEPAYLYDSRHVGITETPQRNKVGQSLPYKEDDDLDDEDAAAAEEIEDRKMV